MQSKPLGRKSYGSIPHLPGSRLGPGDHHITEGQARICTVKARDKHDKIFVFEKLDGANTCVANVNGEILALGRAGYLAQTSPYPHMQLLAEWVRYNALRFDFLWPGERVCGEWLAMAHSTEYSLFHEPWACFDRFSRDNVRLPWESTRAQLKDAGFVTPWEIQGAEPYAPISVENALAFLGEYGQHGATEPIEGIVYRVERKGVFDFAAKWVKPEKIDGKYFPQISGKPPVWNWRP
jgi:hypothetical protein